MFAFKAHAMYTQSPSIGRICWWIIELEGLWNRSILCASVFRTAMYFWMFLIQSLTWYSVCLCSIIHLYDLWLWLVNKVYFTRFYCPFQTVRVDIHSFISVLFLHASPRRTQVDFISGCKKSQWFERTSRDKRRTGITASGVTLKLVVSSVQYRRN